jgi:polysaccharide transporter, PST family
LKKTYRKKFNQLTERWLGSESTPESSLITSGKQIIENILSLCILQGSNYLLPLLLLPYLVRVLGPERFGLLAFSQAFVQNFVVLTDYGFNFTATRELAICRDNPQKVSELFCNVLIIKLGFGLFSFLLMSALISTVPKFNTDWLLYILTFPVVIGNALFPTWFFQGMEKMKYITVLNAFAKLIYAVSVFIFVQQSTDYLSVALLNSLSMLVTGIAALWLIALNFDVTWVMPDREAVFKQLKEGWSVFVSTLSISIYANSRVFIVGLFTNNTITGYYSIAEKIMILIQTFPLAPILQACYPWLSRVFIQDPNRARKIARNLQQITTIALLIGLPVIYFLIPQILEFAFRATYPESILSIRLLLIGVFFINANAFRIHFLLISGNPKLFRKIHITTALLGISMLLILTNLFSYIGAAVSVILVEFFVLMLTIFSMRKYDHENLSSVSQ